MRSLIVEHPGDPGTFKDLPDPLPGPDELLIRITVAGINPIDWKLRDWYQRQLPFTLGQDFAGRVVAVGEQVMDYRYGERVFGIARQHGAYTELTLIPANDPHQPLSHIPVSVGDADAAALPTPGLTAMRCIELAECRPKTMLLIVGVMGSVGQIAAQLAIHKGAKVAGIGSHEDRARAAALGIDPYIAYDLPENAKIEAAIERSCGRTIDTIIDLTHNAKTIQSLFPLLREGGCILSTNHAFDEPPTLPPGVVAKNANLDDIGSSTHQYLRDLAKLLEQGALQVPISKEYDFSSAVMALERMKSGKARGKLLLTLEPQRS